MRVLLASILACALLAPPSLAQEPSFDTNSHPAMSHHHGLELGVGLLAGVGARTTSEIGGAKVDSDVSGLMGSLTYVYRLDDRILLTVTAGALSVDATVSATAASSAMESSTVSMLLFGVRYQLPALEERENLRPHASVAGEP